MQGVALQMSYAVPANSAIARSG